MHLFGHGLAGLGCGGLLGLRRIGSGDGGLHGVKVRENLLLKLAADIERRASESVKAEPSISASALTDTMIFLSFMVMDLLSFFVFG